MILVHCKARLDRPNLPKSQRGCGEQVTSILTDVVDPKYVRLMDYGYMYFRCGHAADKANNGLADDIERSYRNGN